MASTFPAIRGVMGQTEFYCAMLTFGEAARLIEFVEDIDDWTDETDPEAKTQRKLNVARVEREMVPYLVGVTDHFYSALTVEIRPAISDGTPEGVPFVPTVEDLPGRMAIGRLVLDGTETLYALDGQHRLKSIQLAIRRKPELAREQIAVIFVPFQTQRRSQLIFSDLNRYAKSPSKSISLLFSHRDPVVTLAKRLTERVDMLRGRVEMESTSLSKHTPNAITLSTLYEMTRSLLGDRAGDFDALAELERQAAIWTDLVSNIEPWRQVASREEHPAYLRSRYLVMHGVCQQSVAMAIGGAILSNGFEAARLAGIDWSLKNPEWQGIAVQGGHVSNTSTSIRNLAGLISHRLGLPVEPHVAAALAGVIRARGDEPPSEIMRQAESVAVVA